MKQTGGKLTGNLVLVPLFIVPLAFSTATFYLYSVKTPLLQISGIGMLSAWLFLLGRGRAGIFRSPPDMPALFLLLWTGLSAVWAQNKYLALEQFVVLASLVSIYYVVSKSKPSLKLIAISVSAAAGLVSVYGIFQFFGYDFLAEPHAQPVSTLGNVNFAGEFIAPAAVLTAALILSVPGKKIKLVFLIIGLLQVLYLLITRARGAWVGFLFGILFFFVLALKERRQREKLFIYSLSAVAAAVFFVTAAAGPGPVDTIVSEAYSIGNPEHPSIKVRFHVWRSVLGIIRDYPLSGTGAGNLQIAYPVYRSYEEIRISGVARHVNRAHNDFLEFASDLGLAGFGLFAWLLVASAKAVWRGKNRLGVLEAGVAAMAVCILVEAMFGFPLRKPSTALLFWTGLALIPQAGKVSRVPLPRNFGIIKAGSFCLLVFVAAYSLAWLASDIHLQRYRRHAEDENWASAGREIEKSLAYYYPRIRAHSYLASAYLRAGDVDNAYISLQTLIGLNPNHHWANYALGRVYFEFREDDKAFEHIRKAAGLNPRFLSHLGKAYLASGEPDKAEHYILKQFKLGFADAESFLYLGELYEARGDKDRAARAYKRALEKNPGMDFLRERIRLLEPGNGG